MIFRNFIIVSTAAALIGLAPRPVRGQDAVRPTRDRTSTATFDSDALQPWIIQPAFVVTRPIVKSAQGGAPCFSICADLDVVFVMDTSGSMSDEASVLCSNIQQIVSDLEALGIGIRGYFLGITETPGGGFSCLTNSVKTMLGSSVPGNGLCPLDSPDPSNLESWGPASAIIAERFPWLPASSRLIIPISDEAPCNGFPCEDPGIDRDSIQNAIQVAVSQNTIVSPIIGSGANACDIRLAEDLAAGTGGLSFLSTDPTSDLVNAIVEIISAVACDKSLSVTVIDAGLADGFALPVDPAAPGPELTNLLADCQDGGIQFDEIEFNSCFGHTFTGFPQNIMEATVEIRLRATPPPDIEAQCNDELNFQVTGFAFPKFLWTGLLGTGGPSPSCTGTGLIPGAWLADTDYTFQLDLRNLPNADGTFTDILDSLNQTGRLDVRVNNDTGVDYIRLTIVHEADCNANGVLDACESSPTSNGFINGDFSDSSAGWTTLTGGNDSIVFDGATVTISSRNDGTPGTTSTRQGPVQLDAGVFEFDLLSYTSIDVSLFDFPVVFIDGVSYGINHDGTLTVANGIGTINNGAQLLTPMHFVVDAFSLAGAGLHEIGIGVRTLNSANGPGVAVYDNMLPGSTAVIVPDCNADKLLDVCEIDNAYSGVANGNFDNWAESWTHFIRGNGSIQYDGRAVITGDNALAGGSTYTSQTVQELPDGLLEFDLISYTSIDASLFDLPVLVLDTIPYGLNLDGTLSNANGIGTIRNDGQLLTPMHFTVDVGALLGPGPHDIGFGVRSLTGTNGPGVAVFDNITPGPVQIVLDCNLNGVLDSCEITDDPNTDLDGNGVLDVCDCYADCALAGRDGQVTVVDLLELLANWGPSSTCDLAPPGGDGQITVLDLLELLGSWGPCIP